MPTLKFWDGTEYVPISTGGSSGGGAEEVVVNNDGVEPGAGIELWVDETATEVDGGTIDVHTDVDTSTTFPEVGDSLVWNGSAWVPGEPAVSMDALSDVDISTVLPEVGSILVWDGTQYVPGSAPLPLSGGTMTGPMTLAGNPVADYEPASKKYVDDIAYTKVTVSAGAPVNPVLGDIWVIP